MERAQAALKAGASGSGAPPTPTRKLATAIQEENEKFLGTEQQRQQQIIRRGPAPRGGMVTRGWCRRRKTRNAGAFGC